MADLFAYQSVTQHVRTAERNRPLKQLSQFRWSRTIINCVEDMDLLAAHGSASGCAIYRPGAVDDDGVSSEELQRPLQVGSTISTRARFYAHRGI